METVKVMTHLGSEVETRQGMNTVGKGCNKLKIRDGNKPPKIWALETCP